MAAFNYSNILCCVYFSASLFRVLTPAASLPTFLLFLSVYCDYVIHTALEILSRCCHLQLFSLALLRRFPTCYPMSGNMIPEDEIYPQNFLQERIRGLAA